MWESQGKERCKERRTETGAANRPTGDGHPKGSQILAAAAVALIFHLKTDDCISALFFKMVNDAKEVNS
jgi:hypothetical protein